MDRVFDLFDEEYDIQDKPNADDYREAKGDINFEHVSFSYEEDDRNVLKDIHLKLKKEQQLLLSG